MCVNNFKLDEVDKKKESKTTPRVSVKLSAYDKIVQLVTHDNPEVKPPQEESVGRAHTERGTASFVPKKSTYECLKTHVLYLLEAF